MLIKSSNPVFIASGSSMTNGVFASISSLLTLLNKRSNLLLCGESINSAGFTLMGLNANHDFKTVKNAVYYNIAQDKIKTDGFVFDYRKTNKEKRVRINHPFSQKATYLNAFNLIVRSEKTVRDLDYSNIELLIEFLNIVSKKKYEISDFEKEFNEEMKSIIAKIKESAENDFVFADKIEESADKTDSFREIKEFLL
jgi:hypothetical protein